MEAPGFSDGRLVREEQAERKQGTGLDELPTFMRGLRIMGAFAVVLLTAVFMTGGIAIAVAQTSQAVIRVVGVGV